MIRSIALTLTVATLTASAFAQADLSSSRFAPNCGNLTAAPIFESTKMNTGAYGVTNPLVVSDPDIVLIGNQWWMIFATGPAANPKRAIEPFAAYLPPGASLATTTTYPSDPNGWHLVGAQSDGKGIAVAVSPTPSPAGWDRIAAETPSVDVGSDGKVAIYYAAHNDGQTAFVIGLQKDFNPKTGTATAVPDPVMVAEKPWEYSNHLEAILEQSVRWMPQLHKYIMYYTAGGWWTKPPDNQIGYADSTDGIHWGNRQKLDFPAAYYNQDFLYNKTRNRYEMVIAKDPTGVGGGRARDLVWLDAATPATKMADWHNEATLLQHDAANNQPFYASGLLSPAIRYGNLPGEEDRIYVFFHTYTTTGAMYIGRFYCDALKPKPPILDR